MSDFLVVKQARSENVYIWVQPVFSGWGCVMYTRGVVSPKTETTRQRGLWTFRIILSTDFIQEFDNPENEWTGEEVINAYKSKCAHEMDQHGSFVDDSGVDRQLSFVAIDRYQNRQKPINIDAVHEYIFISYATPLILRGYSNTRFKEFASTYVVIF